MAQLGLLRRTSLPGYTFNPKVPDIQMPLPLPVDQSAALAAQGEAAKSQAHGAVLGMIAKTVAELPSLITRSYDEGRIAADRNRGLDVKRSALSSGSLADFSFGPDGSSTYRPVDPRQRTLRDLKLEGDIDYEKARAEALRKGSGTNPLYDSLLGSGGDYVDWIKEMEGKNLNAYSDSGQTSIGYGTRGQPGETIDDAEADRRLRAELSESAQEVDRLAVQSGATLTPAQREALISFHFNTGAAGRVFQAATEGGVFNPERAKAKMAEYIHADAAAGDGSLKGRREKELAWFDRQPSESGTINGMKIVETTQDGHIVEGSDGSVSFVPRTGKRAIVPLQKPALRSNVLKPTATVSQRVTDGINAVQGLQDVLQERQNQPDISPTEKAALLKQSRPASGIFDSFVRQFAQTFVSKDALQLETLRNRVNSMIIFARGGSALTESEKQALTIVEPDDTKEAAITKIQTAIPILKKELKTYADQYPGSFPSLETLLGQEPASATPAAPGGMVPIQDPTGKRFRIPPEKVQEALAAGWKLAQ